MRHGYRPELGKIAALAVIFALLLAFPPAAWAAPEDDCAAGRHSYAVIRQVEPTAMQDGLVTYLCGVCGQQYSEILYATDHAWGPWIVDAEPDCTREGERHRTCNRALSHDEYGTIPALGHDYASSVTREPGCEERGVRTFKCARCGASYTEPIAAVGHAYEELDAREPACLEPGARRFVCAHNPDHAYEEEIPALGGHDLGEWQVKVQPKEGVEGLEARACARCGYEESRALPALRTPPPPPEAKKAFPVMDVVLIGANVGLLGFFVFLIIPYILCLLHIKKRREALEKRDALRREVEKLYGFK